MALVQTSLTAAERDELHVFIEEVGDRRLQYRDIVLALLLVNLGPRAAAEYIEGHDSVVFDGR